MMEYIKNNKKTILIVLILFFGLVATIIAALKPQIFKSKAADNKGSILEISTPDGKALPFENNSVTTPTKSIRIKLKRD